MRLWQDWSQDQFLDEMGPEVFYTPPSRLKRASLIALRSLAALGFLGFVGISAWIGSVSSPDPNPATGQVIREHSRHAHYYLSPIQDVFENWVSYGSLAFAIAMLFTHRLIASYDPVAANLPPRPPNVDPLAD